MARSTIEVPWDVEFPYVCARCTAPATKTKRVQFQRPSAQKWFLLFGVVGAAIAGARESGSLRYEIPYCDRCRRTDRLLLVAAVVAGVLSLLFLCGSLAFIPSGGEEPSVLASLALVLGMTAGVLLLVVVTPALAIILGRYQAVRVKRVNERSESVQLLFRSQPYFERFCQANLERIVSFALGQRKPMPVPLEQAIAVVGQRIDPQNPRLPASLQGYFERGQMYLRAGMYSQAVADLDRVVEVTGFENPYFLDAQFFRGRAHMQTGNHMQAQADLENYLKAASDRGRVRQAKTWLKEMRRR
jgi:tetratricopeptide (TPR) repeat protein